MALWDEIDASKREELRAKYLLGLIPSMREVAEAAGVPVHAVTNVARRDGWGSLRKRVMSDDARETYEEMRREAHGTVKEVLAGINNAAQGLLELAAQARDEQDFPMLCAVGEQLSSRLAATAAVLKQIAEAEPDRPHGGEAPTAAAAAAVHVGIATGDSPRLPGATPGEFVDIPPSAKEATRTIVQLVARQYAEQHTASRKVEAAEEAAAAAPPIDVTPTTPVTPAAAAPPPEAAPAAGGDDGSNQRQLHTT